MENYLHLLSTAGTPMRRLPDMMSASVRGRQKADISGRGGGGCLGNFGCPFGPFSSFSKIRSSDPVLYSIHYSFFEILIRIFTVKCQSM